MMDDAYDIGVLGSGPAALSLAAACGRLGASVLLVAPRPDAPWSPNYCLWADEVPAQFAPQVEHAWPEAFVATQYAERPLRRSYVKLDNRLLRASLWSDLRAAGCRSVAKVATAITHQDEESRVHTADGKHARVRVVIDASGSGSPFVKRAKRPDPAYQIAYGVLLDAPQHRFDPSRAVLMDFRPVNDEESEPPTFLYALPLSDGRLFLEETSLASRPGVSMELLMKRLELRLDAMGLRTCTRLGEERCRIAMGLGLPLADQPLVAFGAAASMVHPASGYSISHALRKADPVARAIVEALASDGPSAAVKVGNASVWPRADRTTWELYRVGLESLLNMGATETSAFFDGFFELPEADWAGFLSGARSPRQVSVIMARIFRNVRPAVQWELVRASVAAGAAPFAKSLLMPGSA